MFILDTDVLSITSPTSGMTGDQASAWRTWVQDNVDLLHFSAITVMEVKFGIVKLAAKGASNKATQLKRWLLAAETVYQPRIVPIGIDIARKAGELLYGAVGRGHSPSTEDAIVAATADVLGYTVLSRNARHMAALSVRWLDPLQSLPESH
jgi:toxin FitB